MTNQSHTMNPIEVRKMNFAISEKSPRHWHGNDPFKTHLFDAVSVLFPLGELFFIETVHLFTAQITDKKLLSEIKEFSGQEAHHTKVHRKYNGVLQSHGYDVPKLEARLNRRIKLAKKYLPIKSQLSTVLAYEHFTALLANAALTHPAWLAGADPEYTALWRWHAAEETEHKSVAFDVYKAIGGGYFRRVFEMLPITLLFLADVLSNQLHMLHKDKQLHHVGSIIKFFIFIWIYPGIFTRLLPGYIKYFSPWFHPANDKNYHLVEAWLKEKPAVPK